MDTRDEKKPAIPNTNTHYNTTPGPDTLIKKSINRFNIPNERTGSTESSSSNSSSQLSGFLHLSDAPRSSTPVNEQVHQADTLSAISEQDATDDNDDDNDHVAYDNDDHPHYRHMTTKSFNDSLQSTSILDDLERRTDKAVNTAKSEPLDNQQPDLTDELYLHDDKYNAGTDLSNLLTTPPSQISSRISLPSSNTMQREYHTPLYQKSSRYTTTPFRPSLVHDQQHTRTGIESPSSAPATDQPSLILSDVGEGSRQLRQRNRQQQQQQQYRRSSLLRQSSPYLREDTSLPDISWYEPSSIHSGNPSPEILARLARRNSIQMSPLATSETVNKEQSLPQPVAVAPTTAVQLPAVASTELMKFKSYKMQHTPQLDRNDTVDQESSATTTTTTTNEASLTAMDVITDCVLSELDDYIMKYSRNITNHTGSLASRDIESSEDDTRKKQTHQHLVLFKRQVEQLFIEQTDAVDAQLAMDKQANRITRDKSKTFHKLLNLHGNHYKLLNQLKQAQHELQVQEQQQKIAQKAGQVLVNISTLSSIASTVAKMHKPSSRYNLRNKTKPPLPANKRRAQLVRETNE
ncbi:hypothetical protein BDF22DRAFT_298667 [Syncephalis plumigaleata]|nr:hypothetical protein BDF22DRAFT_298667 [Syncephalis plumigaleata]